MATAGSTSSGGPGTRTERGRLRVFIMIWSGQFASQAGSGLSTFAMSVYLYQLTGSVATLSTVGVIALLPAFMSPVAGSLADRWGIRATLLLSNIGSIVSTLVLAVLLLTRTFDVWNAYVLVGLGSMLWTLQGPALGSMIPLLVPKRHFGRANGMSLFAMATTGALGPTVGGLLFTQIGMGGIVVIDCCTFSVATLTLLISRIPQQTDRRSGFLGVFTGVVPDVRDVWRSLLDRPGLMVLMLLLAVINFLAGVVDLLVTPLVLAFAAPTALGLIMSVGAVGMISASLAVTVWGGPRRRIRTVLVCGMLMSAAIVAGSLRPNTILISAAAFAILAVSAVLNSAHRSIWQAKVSSQMLGRTLALLNVLVTGPQVIAVAVAGPVAQYVFVPLVGRDRVRNASLALFIGDGRERGIALLLMVTGLLMAGCVGAAALHPRLRRVERELPDVVADDEQPSVDVADVLDADESAGDDAIGPTPASAPTNAEPAPERGR